MLADVSSAEGWRAHLAALVKGCGKLRPSCQPREGRAHMAVVLSISSRVVRGHVGNSGAAFALQRLGHEVWEVPTVVLNHHPGHGKPQGVALSASDLAGLLACFAQAPWGADIGLVLSGYCASPEQVAAIAAHVMGMRAAGFTARYGCDPICGDVRGRYVPEAVLDALRNELVPLSDFLTPNRHELGLLTGMPVTGNAEIIAAARSLDRPLVLVTSAFALRPGRIANLLVEANRIRLVETPELPSAPNGTGDLMTALFAGRLLNGESELEATARAAASVHDVVAESLRRKRDELALVAAQDRLLRPAIEPFTTELR